MADFPQRLREFMEARKISQSDVAAEAGVSQPTISAIVAGGDCKLSTYRRIVAAYPELAEAIAS